MSSSWINLDYYDQYPYERKAEGDLRQKRAERHTKERPCEDGGRGGSNATTAKEHPEP